MYDIIYKDANGQKYNVGDFSMCSIEVTNKILSIAHGRPLRVVLNSLIASDKIIYKNGIYEMKGVK